MIVLRTAEKSIVEALDELGSLNSIVSQLVWYGTNKKNQENFNRSRVVLLTQGPTNSSVLFKGEAIGSL